MVLLSVATAFHAQSFAFHDEIMFAYMDAAKHVKPAPLFAKDFARLIEAKHGIIGRYKTEPMNYDD